jgi:hypothetical protein
VQDRGAPGHRCDHPPPKAGSTSEERTIRRPSREEVTSADEVHRHGANGPTGPKVPPARRGGARPTRHRAVHAAFRSAPRHGPSTCGKIEAVEAPPRRRPVGVASGCSLLRPSHGRDGSHAMTVRQPNLGPFPSGTSTSDPRSLRSRLPGVAGPRDASGAPSASEPRPPARPADVAACLPRRTGHRPEVRPLSPDTSDACLCGDPAELVVDTHWFSGRHSRDPVCPRHVDQVVAAIVERQARRDGR